MTSTSPLSKDVLAYQPRSYQLEMFEASMKENIIVAMDTGSGKTNIALLRIVGELESCNPRKLIWFLAPTVALCIQQHKVITKNIPSVQARTLTGLDKVELWTEQPIWDAVLKNIQVVVSTHAVLADALTHGFVEISQLGLIIFDEAHHCMRRHPANKIMQDFYHPALAKHGPGAVPHIMGLTASPVVRSSLLELLTVESNLASVCKTPRVHRQELLKHTHRPHLQQILFTPLEPEELLGNDTLRALQFAWETLDINEDPYVKSLRGSPDNDAQLQKTLLTRKTYCNEQIKKLVDRSCHIFEELGDWAVEYFIRACSEQLRSKLDDSSVMVGWEDEEKAYIMEFMDRLPISDVPCTKIEDFCISPKLEALMAFLDGIYDPEFSGIIFVQQRATVSVMAKLLSVHPLTKDRFRCAAYVGWSNGGGMRKDMISGLLTMEMQRNTLDEFRDGHKNLIIATDVLEEGIDISSCKVVACYDKPPNLKSFVQRRGRARQRESVFAILLSTFDESSNLSKWQALEKAMMEAYQNDERLLQEARNLESFNEDIKERFTVESTSAVLTPGEAVAHLHHFCSVLPRDPYASNRPEFSFEINDVGLLRGMVTLPSSVHPAVRRTTGKTWWTTERAAVKEAAFQSYKSLYRFGLVNDHLLPLTRKQEFGLNDYDTLPSIVEISEQHDPWRDWASSWSTPDFHQTRIAVRLEGNADYEFFMKLNTPVSLPLLNPMTLFWDSENTFNLSFAPAERVSCLTTDAIQHMREITALYLQVVRSGVLRPERDFVALFGPDVCHDDLEDCLRESQGYEAALDVFNQGREAGIMGIVRDLSQPYSEPLLFKRWLVSTQDPSIVELECERFPRRRNLMHRQTLTAPKQPDTVNNDSPDLRSRVCVLSAETCIVHKFPLSDSIFGLFIPAILDRLEATLIASRLCETTLQNIGFTGTEHVITAITTPSAQAVTNYQRYEFLGDSVLKFTVSCQLFFQHPNWHEGYLSQGRDDIVQNPRLARAALDLGLDSFIISKQFSPRKWSAPLISEKITQVASRRTMSTKVLADIVESLIGAAYLDGGHEKAQACIHFFLPEVNMTAPANVSLTSCAVSKNDRHMINDLLEEQVGYSFRNRSLLLEALTHPSCQHDASTQSYQRLEFLGDAVLDMVIVSTIFKHAIEIPQGEMTMIKHAMVNANLLAFLCMEFAMEQESINVEQTPSGGFAIKSDKEYVELWRFMRCEGINLRTAQERAISRYHLLREEISLYLHQGNHYPWQALSQLNADKLFSDIIESVIGAIFVDSLGNLVECEMFAERIGLLPYLRRILAGGINVAHPMNIAQQMSKGNVQFSVKRIQVENGDASYQCAVTLDGHEAVVVEGCLSREEAEVKAANGAIEILMQLAATTTSEQ